MMPLATQPRRSIPIPMRDQVEALRRRRAPAVAAEAAPRDPSRYERADQHRNMIILALAEHVELTASALCAACGIRQGSGAWLTRTLRDADLIEHKRKSYRYYWILTDKGRARASHLQTLKGAL